MKTLKQFLIVCALMITVLLSMAVPVLAEPTSNDDSNLLPIPPSTNYAGLPTTSGRYADQRFSNLVASVITNVRYVLGAVAILLIVYAGVKMVIAQGAEEEYTTQKRNLMYAIIGLAVVGFSGDLVRILNVYCPEGGKDLSTNLPCTPGGFLKDPNAIIRSTTLFNQRTQFIITFIKYLIGSVAVLMIVRSGLRLVTSFGNEEKLTEDKKSIFYGILGLIFIMMADTAVNNVFYKIDLSRYPSVGGAQPSFNAGQGVKELAGFTNLVVTIVTPIAILMLLFGAFLYTTSATNEENQTKAKRLIFTVIAGLLIMYGAFALVSTIISGSFQGGAGTVTVSK